MSPFNIKKANHYSLLDASNIANCKQEDLLHLASQRKLTLVTHIPKNIVLRSYNEMPSNVQVTKKNSEPYLVKPDFLILLQSHCIQIELNGITKQSDFREGYSISHSGQIHKKFPSDGHSNIAPGFCFWRTFQNGASDKLELSPENLYVMDPDLTRIIESEINPWNSREKKIYKKNYYSLKEASEIAYCTPLDILRYASQEHAPQGEVGLLTGVPDDIDLMVYDDETKKTLPAFLMKPQLLVMMQSHCRSFEINQCDFMEGYFIDSSGHLKICPPGFGYLALKAERAYWRTVQGGIVKSLELQPDHLFVTHAGLIELCKQNPTSILTTSFNANEVTSSVAKINRLGNKSQLTESPWLVAQPDDPAPNQHWYIPARYFAREIVKSKPNLINNKVKLAEEVSNKLLEHKIYKRGGKLPLESGTILKAFSKVTLN